MAMKRKMANLKLLCAKEYKLYTIVFDELQRKNLPSLMGVEPMIFCIAVRCYYHCI